MLNAFAIVHTYHDLKNAEYEVLQRILAAAKRVGARVVVMDRNAKILWATSELNLAEGALLPDGVVDFVLALHFESARVVDAYSYITLWQPIEFYHAFGYQASIDKVTSYHDLVSCSSDLADAHGMNLLAGVGRAPQMPLPKMFHTLPEPFLKPRISEESRLFYIGINWERIGRPKGRFHDALVALDKKDLTDIYGPEKMMGVAPWEGFKTYCGELPFDGEAVKNAINRSGICLVLSSAAHKNAGIMSNRLFEGLAGGAAIIATPNALIDKYFRDAIYLVDDSRGEEHLYQQIVEVLRRIRADPDEAVRRTLVGQEILRTQCSLEGSIQALMVGNAARVAAFEAKFLAQADVTVIVTFFGRAYDDLKKHLEQFAKQRHARVTVHVVCDRRFASRDADALANAASGAIGTLLLHPINLETGTDSFDGEIVARARTGPAIAAILKQVDTPLFAFSTEGDWVFGDHFASLAKALQNEPKAMLAASGMIREGKGLDKTETRTLDSARFTDIDAITLVTGTGQVARFAFRRELLEGDYHYLMQLLDGEEHLYFRLAGVLAGPLAQTNYPSCVFRDSFVAPEPEEPREHQRQYIRDLFARDSRWLDRLNKGSRFPEFVYAYSPGSPVRWQDYTAPRSVTHLLPLDTPVRTAIDGKGMNYLRHGFSHPEPDGIWIEAERGIIDFNLPPAEANRTEDREIVLVMTGRRSIETGRDQHVTVALNGLVVAYAVAPDFEAELRLPIPVHLRNATQAFRIELIPDHSEMVYDASGKVSDGRRLSVKLRSITVERRSSEKAPMLNVDKAYPFGRGQPAAAALVSNFYPVEDGFAWVAGRKATVFFRIDRVPAAPILHLRLQGRKLIAAGRPPIVRLQVNGESVGEVQTADGEENFEIDIGAADISGRTLELVLEADAVEAVYDKDHRIVDSRLIGVAIRQIGVFQRVEPNALAATGPASSGGTSAGASAPARRLLPWSK
jgi:hypothetical protein